MSANGQTGRLFTAKDDLVSIYQFTDKLKSYRCFVELQTPFVCHPIDQMRRRDASCNSILPTATLRQIICQQCDQLVRRDKRAVAVNDPKSVRVAICCYAQ